MLQVTPEIDGSPANYNLETIAGIFSHPLLDYFQIVATTNLSNNLVARRLWMVQMEQHHPTIVHLRRIFIM